MRWYWHVCGLKSGLVGCSRPLTVILPSRISSQFGRHDLHRLTIKLRFRPLGTRILPNARRHNHTLKTPTPLVLSDAQRRTVYALSTPPGKAAVAIIRVSGPHALDVWKRAVRTRGDRSGRPGPQAWKMYRCRIVDPESEEMLDDGLAVYFRGMLYVG
jgi:hypothetical protein